MDKPCRILVIDDEEAMRDSCRQVLTRAGYEVDLASNGEKGLEQVRSFAPDLVLLDLKMPGLSGTEVLEQLPAIDPHLITVVITGYATVESAVEAMKQGAYDYLPKPFSPEELRIIVRRGLERRRYMLETERLLREKEMMRKNFVSLVSHELRSPLAAIQQNLIVITSSLAKDIPEQPLQMLERMKARIKGLITLISDWLNLSRIESGEFLTGMEEVDLIEVLNDVTDLLAPLAQEKEVILHNEAPSSFPKLKGTREILTMLLVNLVQNGIKYNRKGGSVTMTVKREAPELALITVGDTGIGIPKDKLPYIFEQFYRAKQKGSEVEGSGLGLSIVHLIVEALQGSIQVESEENKGTTFAVRLSLAPQTNKEE